MQVSRRFSCHPATTGHYASLDRKAAEYATFTVPISREPRLNGKEGKALGKRRKLLGSKALAFLAVYRFLKQRQTSIKNLTASKNGKKARDAGFFPNNPNRCLTKKRYYK